MCKHSSSVDARHIMLDSDSGVKPCKVEYVDAALPEGERAEVVKQYIAELEIMDDDRIDPPAALTQEQIDQHVGGVSACALIEGVTGNSTPFNDSENGALNKSSAARIQRIGQRDISALRRESEAHGAFTVGTVGELLASLPQLSVSGDMRSIMDVALYQQPDRIKAHMDKKQQQRQAQLVAEMTMMIGGQSPEVRNALEVLRVSSEDRYTTPSAPPAARATTIRQPRVPCKRKVSAPVAAVPSTDAERTLGPPGKRKQGPASTKRSNTAAAEFKLKADALALRTAISEFKLHDKVAKLYQLSEGPIKRPTRTYFKWCNGEIVKVCAEDKTIIVFFDDGDTGRFVIPSKPQELEEWSAPVLQG